MEPLKITQVYCRRCRSCQCQRVHSRAHWTNRRAAFMAAYLIIAILACGLCCDWSTVF